MIHLLWDETHYERHAACGAIERSWAGERLNFTVAPEYASCAWCTEWRGVTDGNVSQNGGRGQS